MGFTVRRIGIGVLALEAEAGNLAFPERAPPSIRLPLDPTSRDIVLDLTSHPLPIPYALTVDALSNVAMAHRHRLVT